MKDAEKIIKALKVFDGQAILYNSNSSETVTFQDIVEYITEQNAEIERLTEENARLDKLLGEKRLDELKVAREIIAQNCILNEENGELQKQVDELKKRLHWIWAIGVDYDGCDKVESLKGLIDEMVELTQIESKDLDEYFTYNTTQGGKMNILNIIRKQAVKDTAKEILQMADKINKGGQNDLCELEVAIKERYGVEVE